MEFVTLNNGVKMPKLGFGVFMIPNDETERCVLDAIDAMLRRLIQMDTAPALTIETEEGERWDLAGGGPRVFGDRENLALWLSRGEEGDLEFEKPLSAPPVWS